MPSETLPPETALDHRLSEAVARAGAALTRRQHDDGHWLFELEADATIPAEYVLLEHYLDRIDPVLEAKIGRTVYHLLRKQQAFDAKRLFAS